MDRVRVLYFGVSIPVYREYAAVYRTVISILDLWRIYLYMGRGDPWRTSHKVTSQLLVPSMLPLLTRRARRAPKHLQQKEVNRNQIKSSHVC